MNCPAAVRRRAQRAVDGAQMHNVKRALTLLSAPALSLLLFSCFFFYRESLPRSRRASMSHALYFPHDFITLQRRKLARVSPWRRKNISPSDRDRRACETSEEEKEAGREGRVVLRTKSRRFGSQSRKRKRRVVQYRIILRECVL